MKCEYYLKAAPQKTQLMFSGMYNGQIAKIPCALWAQQAFIAGAINCPLYLVHVDTNLAQLFWDARERGFTKCNLQSEH